MRLLVKEPVQNDYHRQSFNYPAIPVKSETKPGDTLHSLNADYHVDRVEYSKSDLTVYVTKAKIFQERMN